MQKIKFKSRGFTLIELMVTLSLLAILAGIAIPNLRVFLDRNRFDAFQQDLISSINLARSEAVKRGKRVLLLAKDSGDSKLGSGWRVFVEDEGNPGAFTSAAVLLSDQSANLDGVVAGKGSILKFDASNYEGMMFDATGIPVSPTGAPGNMGFPLALMRDGNTLLKGVVCLSKSGRLRYVKDVDYAASVCTA